MADQIPKVHEEYPLVYHYTSRAGLEGILATQTLFATHYQYLNDKSEIQHMRTALIGNLQHVIKSWIRESFTGNEQQKRFLAEQGGEHVFAHNEAAKIVGTFYDVTFGGGRVGHPFAEPFITSFCAHSDDEDYEQENGLLSQWRGYTEIRANGGFSIVFDTERLSELLFRESGFYHLSNLAFGDVVYEGDIEGFYREFPDLLEKLEDSFAQIISGGPEDLSVHLDAFVNGVSRFKHRAFREEREVRIIICPSTPEFFKYLKGFDATFDPPDKEFKEVFHRPGTKTPTTRLFDYEKEEKLPVVKIIVGPHRNQEENAKFAKALVEQSGMDAMIHLSETPYLDARPDPS